MTDAPQRCERKPRPNFRALVERAVAGRLAPCDVSSRSSSRSSNPSKPQPGARPAHSCAAVPAILGRMHRAARVGTGKEEQ